MNPYKLTNYREPLDLTGPLGMLGAGLKDRRNYLRDLEQQKLENERNRLKDEQYKRQNDLVERRAASQEEREARKYARDEAASDASTVEDVTSAYYDGGASAAEARAKARRYRDPVTGEMRGVDFQVQPGGYERPDPLRLDEPKADPLPGRGVSSMLGLNLRAPGEQPQGDAPATPGAGVAGLLGQRLAAPEPAAPPAELRRAPDRARITTPAGETVDLDPNEKDAHKQRRAEELATRLEQIAADPNLPPDVRKDVIARAAAARARATGADAAAITNAVGREDAQAFTGEQNDKFKLTAQQQEALARLRAARKPAGENWRKKNADKRIGMTEETGARAAAKDVLTAYNFRGNEQSLQKYRSMAAKLAATPNAALDAAISGEFVKMAQGGSGVISDQDMEAFWNRIGGKPAKIEDWLFNLVNGKIPPEKRKEVAAAVHELAKSARGSLDAAELALRTYFTDSPNYAAYHDLMVNTYFGPGTAKKPAPGAAPAAAPAGGAPAAKPAGPPPPPAASLTPRQKQLVQWAQDPKNANTAQAKAIMAKFGGGG